MKTGSPENGKGKKSQDGIPGKRSSHGVNSQPTANLFPSRRKREGNCGQKSPNRGKEAIPGGIKRQIAKRKEEGAGGR